MGARKKASKKTGKIKPGKKKRKSAKADQLGLFAGKCSAGKARPKLVAKPAPAPVPASGKSERGVKKPPRRRVRSAAERMASGQRDISISEFFTKNRHLLGFDNPQKALLTTVKEAVDNSLDACEEAKILPELSVSIRDLGNNRYHVSVFDNGPGIVHSQVKKIFGKLLYGSKFHRLKQSRGQQGIGISAAGMYSQLTTGKPVVITSRTSAERPAHRLQVKIDTRRNEPEVLGDEQGVEWNEQYPTGTRVEMEIEGIYRGGKRSVEQYLEQTAIANPHAVISYVNTKGEETVYPRLSGELPREPLEIKPHPNGVELGMLMAMLKETRGRNLKGALMRDFSRVSEKVALAICAAANLPDGARPKRLGPAQVEALHKAMGVVKIMNPPMSCVVPIGEELLGASLEKGISADFFTSATRSPAVYRGNPFQVEVGLAWGGSLPADELCTLYRFANRVPLQYQQSDCAITKAVIETDWHNYRVSQSRGALPSGPLVILVHIASVWVPFTSESKEAVARYPEILKEIRLALQLCGRRLGHYLSARRREAEEGRKVDYIETYIPHIGIALKEILGLTQQQEKKVVSRLQDTLRRSRKLA
ncbi:MAG TPA: DNA topoisomerase VI subunit B [Myxococcota bacterium]|nr:DNA topoisomerase VI subunit B [Myxococcota bacterium]